MNTDPDTVDISILNVAITEGNINLSKMVISSFLRIRCCFLSIIETIMENSWNFFLHFMVCIDSDFNWYENNNNNNNTNNDYYVFVSLVMISLYLQKTAINWYW